MFQAIEEELIKFSKRSFDIEPSTVSKEIRSSRDFFIFYYLNIVPWNIEYPGLLYLFGRTYNYINNCYVSCSLGIKYCHQRYYFLPRKYFYDDPSREVTIRDVYDDVCENVIPQLETEQVEFRKVRKKYAFDEDIPEEAEYLEIKCKIGNLRLKDQPGNTYSRILGIQRASFLETFLLERNIKGPCWLKVKNYYKDSTHYTNCAISLECYKIDDVIPLEIDNTPPITLMGLELKEVRNELVSANCIVEIHQKLYGKDEVTYVEHFCILSNGYLKYPREVTGELEEYPHTNIFFANGEDNLLFTLIGKISKFDPDIVYGHNFLSHSLDLLYSKVLRYQFPNFYKLSKLKLERIPRPTYKMQLFAGRVLCDTKILAEEMIKSRTYSLHELSKDFLQVPHLHLTSEMVETCLNNFDQLLILILAGVWDVICVHKLIQKLNILTLIFEITKLCGNTLNNTCDGLQISRCEYLIKNAFYRKNFILPCRPAKKFKEITTNIKGGLVLEPEVGLHRNFVLAMDFNALYPSIIREFNVCFTTLKLEDEDIFEVDGEGILPQLVADLITERKAILSEISSTRNGRSKNYIEYLRIKQGMIKRMTNSIFGYLGYKSSRFMAEHLANFITARGRQILCETVALLRNFDSINIIYGDTDSVMVETKLETYPEVVKLSKTLTDAINGRYKYVVIENAGIYKPFYILRKKKYAGIRFWSAERSEEEIKGLDVIRKDWSGISSTVGKKVLREILNDSSNVDVKIYNYLEGLRQDLEQHYDKFDIESFAINKKLNKDPNKYSKKYIEHVHVALRYNQTHSDKMKEGDIVSYVICIDGSDRNVSERVYHVEEFAKSDYLKIDIEYYLSNQIYPVVKRICLPLSLSSLDGKELLIALKVNLRKNQGRAVNERAKKKKKIEEVEPTLDPLINFEVKCSKCKKQQLVSYASLNFVKSCDVNCSNFVVRNFLERLNIFTRALTLSYIEQERTFSQTYEILVNIRNGVERLKRTDQDLPDCLSYIDLTRQELLKDVHCSTLIMSELFQVSDGIEF